MSFKPPVAPKCEVCGLSQPIAVMRSPKSRFADQWLCGSCLYRRDHPDAAPAVKMPRERRALKLQSETLFVIQQDGSPPVATLDKSRPKG